MKKIDNDLQDYDFVWSACALDHLGNLENGFKFIFDSLKCLKPNGVAIHTTELNLLSNDKTIDQGPVVIYRKKDFVSLVENLTKQGCDIKATFNPGTTLKNEHIYMRPCDGPHIWVYNPHLKCVMTSVGVIIKNC
jgi:2-polyprenyl-3-methyl-5-hydroxy-6-metoxy-1,4-benzoquinol methylase